MGEAHDDFQLFQKSFMGWIVSISFQDEGFWSFVVGTGVLAGIPGMISGPEPDTAACYCSKSIAEVGIK